MSEPMFLPGYSAPNNNVKIVLLMPGGAVHVVYDNLQEDWDGKNLCGGCEEDIMEALDLFLKDLKVPANPSVITFKGDRAQRS